MSPFLSAATCEGQQLASGRVKILLTLQHRSFLLSLDRALPRDWTSISNVRCLPFLENLPLEFSGSLDPSLWKQEG